MGGPIQDRTKEHPESSDMPIVVARKMRMNAIKDAQEGRERRKVIRHPGHDKFRIVSISEVVPRSKHRKDCVKECGRK